MKHRIHYSYFLLFVTCSVILADIGDVHSVLKYQLQKCSSVRKSVAAAFSELLLCIEASVYQCLLFHEPEYREYMYSAFLDRVIWHTQMMGACGVINPGQQLTSHTWIIDVHPKYSLNINFLHFRLPSHPSCRMIAVYLEVLGDSHRIHPQQNDIVEAYCGYRMPWSRSFFQSRGAVGLYNPLKLVLGKHNYFVITFDAFDANLTTVGTMHKFVQRLVHVSVIQYSFHEVLALMTFWTLNSTSILQDLQ